MDIDKNETVQRGSSSVTESATGQDLDGEARVTQHVKYEKLVGGIVAPSGSRDRRVWQG